MLEHSSGSFYVFHSGVKLTVQPASTGDQVIATDRQSMDMAGRLGLRPG